MSICIGYGSLRIPLNLEITLMFFAIRFSMKMLFITSKIDFFIPVYRRSSAIMS